MSRSTSAPWARALAGRCIAHAESWEGGSVLSRHLGTQAQRQVCGSLDAVHAAVAQGDCAMGLLPLESSQEGMVNRSHDLLFAGGVKVVGELMHETTDGASTPTFVRYGLIAPTHHPSDGRDDRVMVAVVLPQRTGSLLDLLMPLAHRDIGIGHWCSRPARVEGWHYRFHFTLCALADSEDVQQALRDAASHCSELRLLGRFRAAWSR
ncbi:hypothetical protein H5407_21625 [Mitsuaria sp. WAJ17]|uniref:prephenate dehydratase domain-containing protein n=1 Tax=Mitsuaria sp. WAJ17 TaxID=2761452 RepID=UPI0016004786|nr:prephenate dehydratase domain-containing protein [Mitsuaria sp. WAJ17]MBB2487845.1 hypothetical protein [Mitsuaria sp. WAJ17]